MITTQGLVFPDLAEYADAILADHRPLPDQRRHLLDQLGGFVDSCRRAGETARVVFICTHNSRRSQLAQVWSQTAAHLVGLTGFEAYSGGTQATAFNPRAVEALRRAGFLIDATTSPENPYYSVMFGPDTVPIECFSKIYDQPPNPEAGFCAVMTCSAADSACPVVTGAEQRISLCYEDPKAFDGTDRESAMYDARCRQIAREMLHVFSNLR